MANWAQNIRQKLGACKMKLRSGILQYYQKKHLRTPLRNTIVLECESDMDDNPRAVYEYMLRKGLNRTYKIVWLVNDAAFCRSHYRAKNVEFIDRRDTLLKNWIRLDRHLSTAKWFVFSHPYWFQKRREEQRVIFTGHGNPLKKGCNKPDLHKCYDRMLVTQDRVRRLNCVAWECPEEKVFICGYPRNDLLTAGDPQTVFSKIFPWEQGDRVIMCMPTYKKSTAQSDSAANGDLYSLCVVENQKDFEKLEEFLKENRVHLIVKLHPLQVMDGLKVNGSEHIHYVVNRELFEKKVLLYELLGCCDGLITDFSSVHYDYMLMDRPIAFFMKDFAAYTRGFVMEDPLNYMPGEKVYTLEDMQTYIENLISGQDLFREQRRSVCEMFNGSNTQCNSQRFVELVLSGQV